MASCTQCGNPTEPSHQFCTACGAAQREAAKYAAGKPPGRFRLSKVQWAGVIVGGFFVLMIIIAVVAGEDEPGVKSDAGPAVTSEQRAPTAFPTPTPTFNEAGRSAQSIAYDTLFRFNEDHVGKTVRFTGQIVQSIGGDDGQYQFRINVTPDNFGWDDTIFVGYTGSRFLEGDIVDFIGTVGSLITYESIFGQDITVPAVYATHMRLVSN